MHIEYHAHWIERHFEAPVKIYAKLVSIYVIAQLICK